MSEIGPRESATVSNIECRRFTTPEGCPFGSRCRYKHVSSSNDYDTAIALPEGERKAKPCTKFFSVSGCPFGDGCHFLHYVPGGITSLGLFQPFSLSQSHSSVRSLPPNTSRGPALSPTETGSVIGYKTKLCNRYLSSEGCKFGDKCHFAHGEEDIRPFSEVPETASAADHLRAEGSRRGRSSIYGADDSLPPYGFEREEAWRRSSLRSGETAYAETHSSSSFGSISTAKISIEVSLVGALIGKGGAKVKYIMRETGARVAVRDHESDPSLRNVEIEGTLEQIENAARFVRHFLTQHEAALASANSTSYSRSSRRI